MLKQIFRGLLAAGALAILASLTAPAAQAQCMDCYNNGGRDGRSRCGRHYGTDYSDGLFRQYYVSPGRCGVYTSPMYPAPNTRIPPNVGYTYVTHPKLYPHLYMNRRVPFVRRTH